MDRLAESNHEVDYGQRDRVVSCSDFLLADDVRSSIFSDTSLDSLGFCYMVRAIPSIAICLFCRNICEDFGGHFVVISGLEE